MFKSILIFIKAHMIGTAITATVVVGTTVTGAIIVNHNILDKEVKEHLDILTSSNFQGDTSNTNAEISVNYNEPLSFRIEKINMEDGSSYKIVPSYDKDYSEWTDAEKKEYQKMYNRIAELAKEDYNNAMANEDQAMENALSNLQKIQQSYSKEYMFSFTKDGYLIESENWTYNSHLKLYTGSAYDYQYIESLYKTVTIGGVQYSGVTKEDFRNIAYPNLKQKIENTVEKKMQRQKKDNPAMFENAKALKEFQDQLSQDKQEQLSKLEELYHLSN